MEGPIDKDPDAKGMRNKPFPYYNSWCLIFGKDRATGEYAEGPADAERAFTTDVEGTDDGPIDLTCLNDDKVPPVQPTSNKNATKTTTRKRPRNNEVIASGINLIAESFATHCKETLLKWVILLVGLVGNMIFQLRGSCFKKSSRLGLIYLSREDKSFCYACGNPGKYGYVF